MGTKGNREKKEKLDEEKKMIVESKVKIWIENYTNGCEMGNPV